MTAAPLLLAAAEEEEGGAFLVSPDAGLLLWTVFVFVLVVAIVCLVVYLVRRSRRDAAGR